MQNEGNRILLELLIDLIVTISHDVLRMVYSGSEFLVYEFPFTLEEILEILVESITEEGLCCLRP